MPVLILGYKDGKQKWHEGSLPVGWEKCQPKTQEPKPVEEMTLEELHAVADSLDKKMAVNIGPDKAREKVKAMLEAK